ncbi:MAG TPA: hypothetical protein PLH57_08965 [Oligoflexia bacterium]|nr:hypothetical protein [Oligoflexia bacterium]
MLINPGGKTTLAPGAIGRVCSWGIFVLFLFNVGTGYAASYGDANWENSLLECGDCWGISGVDLGRTLPVVNRWLANVCLEDAKLERTTSKPIMVQEDDYSLCKKGGFFSKTTHLASKTLYWISASTEAIHLHMRLRLAFGPKKLAHDRAATMTDRLEDCLREASEVWARYGINLDIAVDWKADPVFEGAVSPITYVDDYGRSNSETFYFRGFPLKKGEKPRTEKVRQAGFCTMVVHELGHLLGLDDEYEEVQACPDRPFLAERTEPPYSFMERNQSNRQELEFFPRHVARVISPLCKWSK